tara:strand:+ start:1991 stop:2449 length:459 start_codon:yes stop_codon:yes gene_type:complete
MKNIAIIFILMSFLGCATNIIKYDRYKIEKRYVDNFNIRLDSIKINFQNYFLDKENIKSIVVDRKQKTIWIDRVHLKKIKTFSELELDTLEAWTSNELTLTIINGIPYTQDMLNKLMFENQSIKWTKLISNSELLNNCFFNRKRNILVITTD